MVEETFGQRLRRLRTARGLRLRDLGVPSSVRQYESGARLPRSVRVVSHLAQVLDVPIDHLLTVLPTERQGWTPRMAAVLELLEKDPASALALARCEQQESVRHGATEKIWGWAHVVARLAGHVSELLPIDADGYLDPASTLDTACRWIVEDHWSAAAILLESLRTIIPPASPYFGRLAHNTALVNSVLGRTEKALEWNSAAERWGRDQADAWWSVLTAGITVSLTWDIDQYRERFQRAVRTLESWRQADGQPDALALTWADNARASQTLMKEDLRSAHHWIGRLTARLAIEDSVQPEATNIADVQAQLLALEGNPAAALEVIDRALRNAQDMPSYALVPAWITSTALAVALDTPDADRRWNWLTLRLSCEGAEGQLMRLSQRCGRLVPAGYHNRLPPWISA